MESLRIAFLSDRSAPFYPGGYERHIWQLARRLARDHEVAIYTSLPKPRNRLEGVEFIRVAPNWNYRRHQGGHSIVKSVGFGLSCFANFHPFPVPNFLDVQAIPYTHIPGLRLRQLVTRTPWAVTVWEAWLSYPYLAGRLAGPSRLAQEQALRASLFGGHTVIVGSRSVADVLVSKLGVAPARIRIVHPGIDLAEIGGIDQSDKTVDIVCVSRLDPFKRIEDLVLAVDRLRLKGLHPSVKIIGDGPCGPRLRRMVRERSLTNQITLLGFIDEVTKFSLLKSARIFCLPSEREGFSIATLEAMACGACPVVSMPTDPGASGVTEMVQDHDTGLLYPSRDVASLTNCLASLLDDPAALASLRQNAQNRASSFDLSSTTRDYLSAVRFSLRN